MPAFVLSGFDAYSSFGVLPYEVWGSTEKSEGTDNYGDGVEEDEVTELNMK